MNREGELRGREREREGREGAKERLTNKTRGIRALVFIHGAMAPGAPGPDAKLLTPLNVNFFYYDLIKYIYLYQIGYPMWRGRW